MERSKQASARPPYSSFHIPADDERVISTFRMPRAYTWREIMALLDGIPRQVCTWYDYTLVVAVTASLIPERQFNRRATEFWEGVEPDNPTEFRYIFGDALLLHTSHVSVSVLGRLEHFERVCRTAAIA